MGFNLVLPQDEDRQVRQLMQQPYLYFQHCYYLPVPCGGPDPTYSDKVSPPAILVSGMLPTS
jgi:imidazoleglycerol phosphate synthase glutamine amidotransferase subunit HisH